MQLILHVRDVLKLHRALVAQRRVSPSRAVKAVNVVRHRGAGGTASAGTSDWPTSSCSSLKNDSETALSQQLPLRLIEGAYQVR